MRSELERARASSSAHQPVTLIAVSKTFDAEAIEPVIAAGQTVFGENRVQEAKAKWPALKAAHPEIELHLIGPLQSNKAKEAVALFDAIHTVDRPSLCSALAKEITRQNRRPLLFAEINTGAEAQKAGVLPEEADAFLRACREDYGLEISGLMCIPPIDGGAGAAFRADRENRPAQWSHTVVDGNERGLRAGGAVRRHPCPCRQRHFWRAQLATLRQLHR